LKVTYDFIIYQAVSLPSGEGT